MLRNHNPGWAYIIIIIRHVCFQFYNADYIMLLHLHHLNFSAFGNGKPKPTDFIWYVSCIGEY